MHDKRFATIFSKVLTCAVLLLTLGGCGTKPQPPDTSSQRDAGSTEANACRAPDEPGCNPCCDSHADGSCSIFSWMPGTPDASAGVNPWFNAEQIRSACPAQCRACARCTQRHEQEIQQLGVRPECDCTKPTGIDPCMMPGSCACYCREMTRLSQHCPDLVPRQAPVPDTKHQQGSPGR